MRTLSIALLVAACLLPAMAGSGDELIDEYRTRRAAVTDDDTGALCRLALWCRGKGLTEQARTCFEAALKTDPESLAARRGLGYEKVAGRWLRGPALKKARGFVHVEGRWVLREEAIAHEARRREALLADEKRREALEKATHLVKSLGGENLRSREAARKALLAIDAKTTFRPLVAALNSSGPVTMRRAAVEILASYQPKETLRPIIRASITDPDATVRDTALTAVRGMNVPGKLAPYVTALGSLRPQIRQNAVDAIGKLGDITGVQILIKHWQQWGGGTPRAHIYLGTQTSFIQDFDVEVAQTAFIADPIVGIVQDGLTLDVRPTVSNDRRYVTLELQPTVATLLRPIPTFTTSLGAFTTPVTIQIPEITIQKSQTTVRVPDGGTVVIGGLKNIAVTDRRSATPWLSKIPLLGFFFKREGDSEEVEHLMIIITAHITDLKAEEERHRR